MKGMKKYILSILLIVAGAAIGTESAAQAGVSKWVNPFVGSSNYGTTNPGAVCPNGMMSATPFNVMGSDLNRYDKDKRWWSTPYTSDN